MRALGLMPPALGAKAPETGGVEEVGLGWEILGGKETETSAWDERRLDREPKEQDRVRQTVGGVDARDKRARKAVGQLGLAGRFDKGPGKSRVAVREMEAGTIRRVERLLGKRGIEGRAALRSGKKGGHVGRSSAWGRRRAEDGKEGVVGNNEEEGGERTTLFDAPLDGNIAGGGAAEKGSHLDVMKGTADEVSEPVGKGSLIEDREDPGVIDGIESLGRIEQEDVPLDVINDALVEELVEVCDVGVTMIPARKPF